MYTVKEVCANVPIYAPRVEDGMEDDLVVYG